METAKCRILYGMGQVILTLVRVIFLNSKAEGVPSLRDTIQWLLIVSGA